MLPQAKLRGSHCVLEAAVVGVAVAAEVVAVVGCSSRTGEPPEGRVLGSHHMLVVAVAGVVVGAGVAVGVVSTTHIVQSPGLQQRGSDISRGRQNPALVPWQVPSPWVP